MFDVALVHSARADARINSAVARPGLRHKDFVLAIVQRAENTNDASRLAAIAQAFCEIGRTLPVVLPLHPRTRAALIREGLLDRLSAVSGWSIS